MLFFAAISAVLMVTCCIAAGITFVAGLPWVPIEFIAGAILCAIMTMYSYAEYLNPTDDEDI